MVDVISLQDQLFDRIQQKRIADGLSEIRDSEELGGREKYTANDSLKLRLDIPDGERENVMNNLNSQIQGFLENPGSLDPAQSIFFTSALLGTQITHLSIDIDYNDEIFEANIFFRAFHHYFDIEPLGPIIDGDLLIQGYAVSELFGPSLVVISVVDETVDEDGNTSSMYQEISTIPPNRMMINPPDEDNNDERIKYLIPVSIDVEHRTKKIELKIYVQQKSLFSYEDDAASDFDSHENRLKMILSNVIRTDENEGMVHRDTSMMEGLTELETPQANQLLEDLEVTTPGVDDNASRKTNGSKRGSPTAGGAGVGVGGGAQAADEFDELLQGDYVVKDIHIATDYDDVITLQAEGYRLLCTGITPYGPISDQDHLWKFHILAGYGTPSEPGLEDIQFVKCLKSLGTLPAVPFYNIMHDYDLSSADDDYSVYIATKTGMNAKFKKVVMLSSAFEHEEMLDKYVNSVTGVYRSAPKEIQNAFGGSCGILLVVNADNVPQASSAASVASKTSHSREGGASRKVRGGGAGGDDGSYNEDDDDLDDDEDDDDYYDDTEEIMRGLEEQVEQLEAEKATLKSLNSELQKKAVALMTREKALQGQTAAVRASDMMNQLNGGGNDTKDSGTANNTTNNNTQQPEQPAHNTLEYMEKEKQYQDTLLLIVEERNKLNKQLKEFDQLALDLQTRLDDKEFKAKSIMTSFKQFKKEILSKAENSRTGHQIPKSQIQAIEQSESKHEEDLEKVRLRHISLKTLQKKLERTLRAREQLAEGLHMIDFEQLKIENQTLNEKIEERNEELSKLKRKKTTTVQVLTHIREKLRFVEQANHKLREKVAGIDEIITESRNRVTLDKLERDSIRTENKEWKAKQGFATSDLLLVDFEKRKHRTEELQAAIIELKNRYEILMKQVNSVPTFSSMNASGGGPGGSKLLTNGSGSLVRGNKF